jgi:hypothetical protein
VFFNPQVVISKLDIKLRILIPTSPPPFRANPWVSQTPYNLAETFLQITLVKNRITRYQGNSLISFFSIIALLAKDTERLAYELILVTAEIYILRKANKVFSKRRRAKKNHIRQGGALTIKDIYNILAQEEVDKQIRCNKYSRGVY